MEWNSYVFGVTTGLLLAILCDHLQRVLLGKSWQYTNPNKQRHPCVKRVRPPEPPQPPPPPGKTGRLVFDGRRNLGFAAYDWWKCVDCLSIYPVIGEKPSCNRTPIDLCPWCRPDSKPNCYGRGN